MKSNKIIVRPFNGEDEVIDISLTKSDLKSHGGGDSGIISDYLDMLIENKDPNYRTTTLAASLESHYVALAAEESRNNGGENIKIEEFLRKYKH